MIWAISQGSTKRGKTPPMENVDMGQNAPLTWSKAHFLYLIIFDDIFLKNSRDLYFL